MPPSSALADLEALGLVGHQAQAEPEAGAVGARAQAHPAVVDVHDEQVVALAMTTTRTSPASAAARSR